MTWDRPALDAAVAWLGEVGTRQFLVVDQGEVVVEHYWNDHGPSTTIDVGSVQKPLTSVVVGTLVADGRLDVDLAASTWLGSGWTGCRPEQEDRIQLRHLLSMTSGLLDDFTYDAEPGTVWYYNNHAYHQVRRIIEVVTGQTTEQVFAESIFGPAGMDSSHWEEREAVDPTGRPLAGLRTTAPDLAAFATALLADRYPVDPGYRSAMTAASQELNPAYGLLWWNYDASRVLTPGLPRDRDADCARVFSTIELDRRIAPSAPAGLVGGTGMGEQRLYVIPGEDIVVVRLGRTPSSGGPFDEALWSRLAPALPHTGAS